MLPGRVGGYYLNDLFFARKLHSQENYFESIVVSQRLLETLNTEPWRAYFLYCFYQFYTWNIYAMVQNNIGAAYMMLGELEKAKKNLDQAKSLDPKYPLPYYNLAIVEHVRGNIDDGELLFQKANKLGYSRSNTDKVIHSVGEQYARLLALSVKS